MTKSKKSGSKPSKLSAGAASAIASVKGTGAHVFADIRPSSDIDLNTEVTGETSETQVKQPLPPLPTGPLVIDLADIIGADAIAQITKSRQLVFHAVGDTGGVHNPQAQLSVANRMEQDLALAAPDTPSFFLHIGDVVYYDGEADYYYEQFYYPYRHYNAPIFAIPGNHDGDMPDGKASPDSLAAFVENFCAKAPVKTAESKDCLRTAMTQPYVYFQLNTPLATFINLYTNCPGTGYIDSAQQAWLAAALKGAPADKALILSLHHPVFSEDSEHGSNAYLLGIIDGAVGTGRHPDLVLTGHVHNYQRFTRPLANGDEVPYIVAGCGGYYDLYPVGEYKFGAKVPSKVAKNLVRTNPDRTLVNYVDTNFGYLRFTVTPSEIRGVFEPCLSGVGISGYKAIDPVIVDTTKPADTFTINLGSHKVINS